jgi:hypothetical protein
MAIAAYPVLVQQRIADGGMIGAIPTTALIAGMPWLPDSLLQNSDPTSRDPDANVALAARIEWMWRWQRGLLRHQAHRIALHSNDPMEIMMLLKFLADPATGAIEMPVGDSRLIDRVERTLARERDDTKWAAWVDVAFSLGAYYLPGEKGTIQRAMPDDVVLSIVARLNTDDINARLGAIMLSSTALRNGTHVPELVSGLVANLGDTNTSAASASLALATAARTVPSAREAIIDGLSSTDPTTKVYSLVALRRCLHEERFGAPQPKDSILTKPVIDCVVAFLDDTNGPLALNAASILIGAKEHLDIVVSKLAGRIISGDPLAGRCAAHLGELEPDDLARFAAQLSPAVERCGMDESQFLITGIWAAANPLKDRSSLEVLLAPLEAVANRPDTTEDCRAAARDAIHAIREGSSPP